MNMVSETNNNPQTPAAPAPVARPSAWAHIDCEELKYYPLHSTLWSVHENKLRALGTLKWYKWKLPKSDLLELYDSKKSWYKYCNYFTYLQFKLVSTPEQIANIKFHQDCIQKSISDLYTPWMCDLYWSHLDKINNYKPHANGTKNVFMQHLEFWYNLEQEDLTKRSRKKAALNWDVDLIFYETSKTNTQLCNVSYEGFHEHETLLLHSVYNTSALNRKG